jgi:AraC-like DNA-binding protein
LTAFDAVGSTSESAQPTPNFSDQTDVVSAVLAPCRILCRQTRLWKLNPPWGMELLRAGPGFLTVRDGTALYHTSGATGDLKLRSNEFVVVTREESIVLRDQPESRVTVTYDLSTADLPVNDGRQSGGAAVTLFWGSLATDDDYTRQALNLLPPFLLVRGEGNDTAPGLTVLVNLILEELQERRPGRTLLVDRLLHALLVVALRSAPPSLPNSAGLVKALSVPGLGVALAAMHSHPHREWSVNELAKLAGLSRSKFSLRFVEMLGCPPFDYLRDVRMRLACQLLQESDHGIREISARVGYGTEASFSRAFSNWCGAAPGTYRRQKRSPTEESAAQSR